MRKTGPLTKKQWRIVRLLAETGWGNARLAEQLGLAEGTVVNQVNFILAKKGCENRTELVSRYLRKREALAAKKAAAEIDALQNRLLRMLTPVQEPNGIHLKDGNYIELPSGRTFTIKNGVEVE